MKDSKEKKLSVEVAGFVLSKVQGTELSLFEISSALGRAIAIVAMKPLVDELKAFKEKIPSPGGNKRKGS